MARTLTEIIFIFIILFLAYNWYQEKMLGAAYENAIKELNNNITALNNRHIENKEKAEKKKQKFNLKKVEEVVQNENADIAIRFFNDNTNKLFNDSMVRHKRFAMRESRPALQRITPGTW